MATFSSNADSANVNPILAAARENWDNDPWGQSLAWLDALAVYVEAIADETDSHEAQTVQSLYNNDGEWSLPQATDDHVAHAARVFDRMADVAKANGLAY